MEYRYKTNGVCSTEIKMKYMDFKIQIKNRRLI